MVFIKYLNRFQIGLFIVSSFTSSVYAQNHTEITIDASTEYQTIDCFGASDCWSMQKIGAWELTNRERVADLLFSQQDGIGLSAWRFNIGAGINRTTISHPWRTVETFEVAQGEYDWSRQEEERWFLQAAKDRGVESFTAFINSPPARMTRNNYTNCTNGLGSTNLKDGYESQFATYMVDILQHFKEAWDIDFNYISPVNEPQWEWNNGCNQEGNRASNEDVKNITTALYDELKKQQVSTHISLIESGDLKSWYQYNGSMRSEYGEQYGNYLEEFYADSILNKKIANHFGGHSYWSDRVSNQLIIDRNNAKARFRPYLSQGWKYWVTEYCILDGPEGEGGHGRDLTMKTALNVTRIIHYDLTITNASAWFWWTAVSPEDYKDGLIYTNYKNNPNSQSIIESKLLWAFGNFSRYIRPGSIRIKLTGANDRYGLMGSAYLNNNRDELVIVFVNMGENTEPIKLNITGLSLTSLTPYVTTDNVADNLKAYDSFNVDDIFEIPARSVVTLVAELQNTNIKSSRTQFPLKYKLFQNCPNPFNPTTTIEYDLPKPGDVRLAIYDLLGQRVKMLIDARHQAGHFQTTWNGTDEHNLPVTAGLYFCRMESGNFAKVTKLVVVR